MPSRFTIASGSMFLTAAVLRHSARPALHEGEGRDARRDLRVDLGLGPAPGWG